MIPNTNPDTGIRYGVISCNSLDSDLVQELMFGPQAVDLDYQNAYREAKNEARLRFDREVEEAEIAAAEIGDLTETQIEAHMENWLEVNLGHSDLDDYVESALEKFSDMYQGDEATIEGTYQGTPYHITYLGGAPILYVVGGETGYAHRLCSPCVPGAADLDGGFSEYFGGSDGGQHHCYVVPLDWLAQVPA